MAARNYYYQCDKYSKVGRQLNKFWHKAVNAARRADDYVRKYGGPDATYIPPVQFYEGGVDYIEFKVEPDPRVWRKKFTSADGYDEYEPNCMYRADVLALPDDRFHPSNTWNKVYSRQHITWSQARPMKPLEKWAAIAQVQLTGDRAVDAKAINERMENFSFVSFIEFYGDGSIADDNLTKRTCPGWLRRAIRAEQDRQRLPVVEVSELFALLQVKPIPARRSDGALAKDGIAVPVQQPTVTPTFFLYDETYYIATEYPCLAEGLHSVLEGVYNYKRTLAEQKEKKGR